MYSRSSIAFHIEKMIEENISKILIKLISYACIIEFGVIFLFNRDNGHVKNTAIWVIVIRTG